MFSEPGSAIQVLNLAFLKFEFGIVCSLKMRFTKLQNRLVNWAQFHAAGSNLAMCLRVGPELLGTVA